jgi:hypothetical protein
MFNYGLSDFLQAKTTELYKRNEVVFLIRTRRCIISDELFHDNHGGSFRVKNSRTRLDWDLQDYKPRIAPWLFDSFKRIGSNSDVKDSIVDLRELLELLGYIPSKNATLYSMYCNISREKFVKFINLQKKTFWPIRYSMVYGNWLNAVVATGYLGKEGFKKTLYGYKVIAKDGHVCNSFAEKIIDDWLYNNNIEHEKEPAYPDCIRDFLNSKVRADWKIGDIYVEYFGLQTNKDYAKKTEDKIMSCQLKGVSLLPLYPGDEFHLDDILKTYLK